MNSLLHNFIAARDALYEHCGFREDWVAFPIEDQSQSFWRVENRVEKESKDTLNQFVRWADSVEQLKDVEAGKWCSADLIRHRFFDGKSVYRGEEFTLIIGHPGVDGSFGKQHPKEVR
jgi:hypothetical protein